MFDSNFSRVVIINFISALIITLVACYFLKRFNLTQVMHIANIFGLYFLAVYGVDILVESGDIKNNYQRFLFVLILIILFDAVFMFVVPLFFGDVFTVSDYLALIFDGVRFDLTLNTSFYLAVFALLMLIFNFLLFLKDRKVFNGE